MVKVRDHGRVVSKALVVAYAVHETGVREVIGLDLGEVESGAFWTEFLRSLQQRGLDGVRLAVSDQHEGLKAAIARVLAARGSAARCTSLSDMVMHCRRDQRGLVAAALREIFNAEHHRAGPRARHARARAPRAGRAEGVRAARGRRGGPDRVLRFPAEHWTKLRSTNPLERVNKEIGRRTDVVGIFPNDQAVIRLAGALLSEQNDEWLVQRRYLSVESMALTLAAEQPAPEHTKPSRRCPVSPPPEPPAGPPAPIRNRGVARRRVLSPSKPLGQAPATDRTRRSRPSARASSLRLGPFGLGVTPHVFPNTNHATKGVSTLNPA